MRYKLLTLICCIMMAIMLSGCKGSGGSSSASFSGGSGGFDVADSGFDDGYGDGDGSGPYNPEPATVAMLSSGLLAYGFIRRKKKK